jgi:hypothetical protein
MADLTPDARFALIEERLGTGAQAFAELRGKLGRLAWWALGLVTLVIGIAFAAGQVVVEVREARSVQHEIKGELEQLKDTATHQARPRPCPRAALRGRRPDHRTEAASVSLYSDIRTVWMLAAGLVALAFLLRFVRAWRRARADFPTARTRRT